MPICFQRRNINGVYSDRLGSQEDLGPFGSREIVIRIYCMRKISLQKRENRKPTV